MSDVDDAVREFVATARPEAVVIGWALVAEYVLPTSADQSTVLRTLTPPGQSVTQTIGLHTLAGDYHRGTLTGEADV